MLKGRSELSLDVKGRMAMPAKHRPALVDPDTGRSVVVTTVHPRGFLVIYPYRTWLEIVTKLEALSDEQGRELRRVVIGNAHEDELDGSGRILIPSELREEGRLEKEITLVGVGNSLELWPTDEYRVQRARDREKLAAADLSGISL
ncbi:MAG: division/cell wall cluster transcriptional repressor MraZ [Burkholderiaceae bacterium]